MPDQIQSDESAQRLREVRARFDAAVADNPTADAELDFADHDYEDMGFLLDLVTDLQGRLADLPSFTERVEYETQMEWRGCRCGHPGAGCYCQSTRVRTGRFRIIRECAPQVGEWQHPSAIRTPPGHPTSPEAAS